jgi:hypothetical protein
MGVVHVVYIAIGETILTHYNSLSFNVYMFGISVCIYIVELVDHVQKKDKRE